MPANDGAETVSCALCDAVDNEMMVKCDHCAKWFHFVCAEIEDDVETIKNAPWYCNDECKAIFEANAADKAKKTSVKKSSQAKQLEKLEEQQRLTMEAFEKTQKQLEQLLTAHEGTVKENTVLKAQLAETKATASDSSYEPDDDEDRTEDDKLSKKLSSLLRRQSELDTTMAAVADGTETVSNPAPKPTSTITAGNSDESSSDPISVLTALITRQFIQDLPEFDGDERKFASFKSIFESTTQQGHFTEYENVLRLRKALKGDAEGIVRHLLTYSRSATEIINHLEKCYGRSDVISAKLLDDLIENLPTLVKANDPKLKSFAVKVKTFVADVKALNRSEDLKNDHALVRLSMKLVDTCYYRGWSKKKIADPKLNLEDFANFLMEKVIEMPPSCSFERSKAETSGAKNKIGRPVMSHVRTNQNDPELSKPAKGGQCVKCGNAHRLWTCAEFKAMNIIDRWALVKSKRLCFRCLDSSEHQMGQCQRAIQCKVVGCSFAFNPLLHDEHQPHDVDGTQQIALAAGAPAFVPGPQAAQRHNLSHNSDSPVLFKILPVCLTGPDQVRVNTYAMLDGGSSLTMIDKTLIDQLGLRGSTEMLELGWTKGITRVEESFKTSLKIAGGPNRKQHSIEGVYAVENLNLPKQTMKVDEMKRKYKHLKGLPLADLINAQPTILIGIDNANLTVESQAHVGGDNDPVACKTPLGWTVFGKSAPSLGARTSARQPIKTGRFMFHELSRIGDAELHEEVKKYFSTENFGVMPTNKKLIGRDDRRALEVMERTLNRVDSRYEIGLLWKRDGMILPDSFSMAMKRLVLLERSLKKKPEILQWKNEHMKSLLDKGYARIATEEELKKSWPRIWYAPTFVVVNENKFPPKPRDVADVAAQVNGVSLNSNLLKGPDNTAPLLAGLFKFREGAIAVNADVKEMFHQIRIIEEDQQCQRISWRDGDETKQPTVYIMQAMMFGPTCSPSCAQFVKNRHAELYRDKVPEAAAALVKTTFVDDYFNSHSNVEEALRVMKEAIAICSDMGFDLIIAQSNSLELLKRIPEQNIKPKLVSLDPSETGSYITKVLGMYWVAIQDYFTFKFFGTDVQQLLVNPSYHPTKRDVLKILMKAWDPLGAIAHYMIQGKTIMQDVWRSGVEWDSEIPTELK